MKKQNLAFALSALAVSTISTAIAGDAKSTVIDKTPIAPEFDAHRVDAHAPIGVMGDHTHETGEWMVSYRYMQMSMDGHRAGMTSLSAPQVYDFGFNVAVQQMESHMHMLGMMYAPNDWFTFTSMVNYIQKDMQLISNPHGHGHGHGGGHGGSNQFGHKSDGLGDITVGGLFKIYDENRQRVHLNLSVVLPTAEVDEKQNGVFLPYGMQLGAGTFGIKPGITYLGQSDFFSWGAQASAHILLEDENDSGFSLGDSVNATTWLAYVLSDNVSLSARLNYTYSDALEGHYNGPHNHAAPTHFTDNFGGHVLEAGAGVNVLLDNGYRFGVEGLLPVYQDLNGVGLDREFSVIVGIQKSF